MLNENAAICPNSGVINATFSQAMNPATLNASTFTLSGPGAPSIKGTITYASATNTATFTPSASLAANTKFTATITTGAADTFGNTLETSFPWTFTTSASCGVVVPTVTISDSVGSCPNRLTVISATFSKAMDGATIDLSTFTLTGPDKTNVTGAVAYDQATHVATFTPSNSLIPSGVFTATMTTGVADMSGDQLAKQVTSTFTASASCPGPPIVTLVTPNVIAPICPEAAVVSATFSKAMNPATINTSTFTLSETGGASVAGKVSYVAATLIATFTPTIPLLPSKPYTVIVTTGAADTAGDTLAEQKMWNFTTSASCAPTVTGATPNGIAPVCPEAAVVSATFSKAMNPATINTSTFTLNETGGAFVAGKVSYVAATRTATFTPTSPLSPTQPYTAIISPAATDTTGDPLAEQKMWNFTTSASCAPTVTLKNPNGLCPDTANEAVVSATFSKAMNPATINTSTFLLSETGGASVSGNISYIAGTKVATFTPSTPLLPGRPYIASVTTGVADTTGDTLAATTSLNFTTSASCVLPTSPLKSACHFGALASATVTALGGTSVGGDVGVSPGSAVTGFPPATLTGTIDVADAVSAQAIADLQVAYNNAGKLDGGTFGVGTGTGTVLKADIGGETLPPGVYRTTSAQPSLGITGNLTLSGDANAVWTFQIDSTLTTAVNNSNVILIGGALPQNVYWQVGSSATLGGTTTFAGTIMAQASVSLGTGVVMDGRALALAGGVVMLADDTIVVPPCQ